MLVELVDGETPSQRLSADGAFEFVKKTKNIPVQNKLKVNDECLHLIKRCLDYDKNQRITIDELLKVSHKASKLFKLIFGLIKY